MLTFALNLNRSISEALIKSWPLLWSCHSNHCKQYQSNYSKIPVWPDLFTDLDLWPPGCHTIEFHSDKSTNLTLLFCKENDQNLVPGCPIGQSDLWPHMGDLWPMNFNAVALGVNLVSWKLETLFWPMNLGVLGSILDEGITGTKSSDLWPDLVWNVLVLFATKIWYDPVYRL